MENENLKIVAYNNIKKVKYLRICIWSIQLYTSNICTILTGVVVQSLSRVWLFVTPQTVAHQVPVPMGFSRQEYWGRLLFLSPGDLPDPGNEPTSLTSPALVGRFFTEPPGRPPYTVIYPLYFYLHIKICKYMGIYVYTEKLYTEKLQFF